MNKRLATLPGMAGAVLLLAGCAPHQQVSQYFTRDAIALRAGQEDDATIVAWLPRGTEVVPVGAVGSHNNSTWKVETPMGTGWVFTRYLRLQLSDIGPI